MNEHQKSGPCYSNVSLIKKVLFQSKNGSLPIPDIVLNLNLHWSSASKNSLSTEKLVEMALFAPKSFFLENENGLWEVRDHTNAHLDSIIQYAQKLHRQFQVKEMYIKLKPIYDLKILEQYFLRDIRFIQIQETPFWMLAEWELMNDLVYEYMQKHQIEKTELEKITTQIINEYDLDYNISIFAPQLDERFTLQDKQLSISLTLGKNDILPLLVPEEIKEQVSRKSIEILRFIQSSNNEVWTKDIIPSIFNIKANDMKFSIYYEAVEQFLFTVNGFSFLSRSGWVFNQAFAAIELEEKTQSWKYAIYGSVPIINNANELLMVDLLRQHSEPVTTISKTEESSEVLVQIGYHTLSYYERVKGYLAIPPQIVHHLTNKCQVFGIIQSDIEGFMYEWLWRNHEGAFYFYGDGVIDFFSEYLLEVGQKLKIQWLPEERIRVDLLAIDDRYSLEQNRYLDIGRLVEEGQTVQKSIFTIMCEIIATYPSGMHWTLLLELVNDTRSTTKNTVYNILSKNECFENLQEKKGYWRLVVSKLSRYFIDENNNETSVDYSQNIERDIIIELSQKIQQGISIPLSRTDNINDYESILIPVRQNSYNEKQYSELPNLWAIFSKWADKQKNMRYKSIIDTCEDNKEIVECITNSYSKILVNFAKSRTMYSIEHMDLVQEGFFGLIRGIQTYNYLKGNSFANHIRRWVFSKISRYIDDTRTLVSMPVHAVENIHKYEKLCSQSLLMENRRPSSKELKNGDIKKNTPVFARLRNTDYISFEQLWLTYDRENSLQPYPHWFNAEYIDEKTEYVYYEEKSKAAALKLLDLYTNVIEPEKSSEFLDNSFEELVNINDLRRMLLELLEMLPVRDQDIIKLRFGFYDNNERTLEEVGNFYGLTRERIRQIEVKTLRRLAIFAANKDLQVYLQEDFLEERARKRLNIAKNNINAKILDEENAICESIELGIEMGESDVSP